QSSRPSHPSGPPLPALGARRPVLDASARRAASARCQRGDDLLHIEVGRRHPTVRGTVIHPDAVPSIIERNVPAREDSVGIETFLLIVVVRRQDRLCRTGDHPRWIFGGAAQPTHRIPTYGLDAVVELEPTFINAKWNRARAG